MHFISNSKKCNKTLVFIHGIASTSATFSEQIEIFKEDYYILSIDLPGYGGSKLLEINNIKNYADTVYKFLLSKKIKKPILIGHSLGGMIVQQIIADHKGFAEAAVLIATTAKFGSKDLSWQNKFINSRLKPLEDGKSMKEISVTAIKNITVPSTSKHLISTASKIMASISKEAYKSAILSLINFDLRHKLNNINIPILLISGDNDKQAPAKTMLSMSKKIKYSQYYEIKNCGHLIHIEKSEIFNDIIKKFISTL